MVSITRTITELSLWLILTNILPEVNMCACFLILPKFSLFVGLLFHGTQTSFSTSLLQLHQSSGKENFLSISVMHVKYVILCHQIHKMVLSLRECKGRESPMKEFLMKFCLLHFIWMWNLKWKSFQMEHLVLQFVRIW